MPRVRINNLSLHYNEYKPESVSTAPIILLHGFTLDRRMWAPSVPFFESNGYHLILMDACGHGLSDAPSTGYSRADRVEDLARFVDALELERFHIVGLSMGGSTAIGYALKNQERLRSMTLVSTGAAGWDIGKRISKIDQMVRERGVEAAREKWLQISTSYYGSDQADIKNLMERMIRDHSGAPWLDERRGKYPHPGHDLERVHEIMVPTCIFAGSEDRIFVPLARELDGRIPNSRLHIYEDIGHMVNLEAPEKFNADMLEFLSDIETE